MPSTATITSFFNFIPNTKARATEVNTNLSVFRGHLINVDPNTAASTDITYDLGSDEHRWREAYVRGVDFDPMTSTASLLLRGSATHTLGAFLFQVEGTDVFRVQSTGPKTPFGKSYQWDGITTTTDITAQTVSATVGGLAFLMNGSIIFAFSSYGAEHQYIQPRAYSTNGAATSPASIVLSPQISYAAYPTAPGMNLPNSTCTIQTVGRPVRVSFVVGLGGGGYYGVENLTGVNVAATEYFSVKMSVLRDGTTIGTVQIATPEAGAHASTSTAGQVFLRARNGPGQLCIDLNPGSTSGSSNYYLQMIGFAGGTDEYIGTVEGRLQVETIY